MLYQPPDQSRGLWDTWLFRQGEMMHVFHLQRQHDEIGCSSIGHAVTRDWVHWETLPDVLAQGDPGAWDAGPLMTGMVLEHEGRYFLFYGAMVDRVQRIGVATSDDLIHWEKAPQNPLMSPAGPWYQTDPIEAVNYETAWRDPYVFWHAPEGCYYALICARVHEGEDAGGGCVAVARSEDLLRWELRPPAYVSDVLTCMEVPECFRMGGRHYITFTTSYHFGTPYPAADPFQSTGSFYLVSDEMLGGYRTPDQSNALNAGMPTVISNYVGRSIAVPGRADERLYYYHHVFPPRPGEILRGALAAPKRLVAREDGSLSLRYLPEVFEPHAEPPVRADAPLDGERLLAVLIEDAPDGIFQARVSALYCGIVFRLGARGDEAMDGLAVWLAPSGRDGDDLWAMLGPVQFAAGPRGMRPGLGSPAALRRLPGARAAAAHDLRVVCRDAFVDVYVDDELAITHTYAPDLMPQAGGAGVFYAGRPKASPVAHAQARQLTLRPVAGY